MEIIFIIFLGIIWWHITWITVVRDNTKIGKHWIVTPKTVKKTYPKLNWFGVGMVYLGLWITTPISMIISIFYWLCTIGNDK